MAGSPDGLGSTLTIPDPDGRTAGVPHIDCEYLAELAPDNTWSCVHCGTSGPVAKGPAPSAAAVPQSAVEAVERVLAAQLAPFRLPRTELHDAAVAAAREALNAVR